MSNLCPSSATEGGENEGVEGLWDGPWAWGGQRVSWGRGQARQQYELMGPCGGGFQTSEEHAQSVRDLGRHLSGRSIYENE